MAKNGFHTSFEAPMITCPSSSRPTTTCPTTAFESCTQLVGHSLKKMLSIYWKFSYWPKIMIFSIYSRISMYFRAERWLQFTASDTIAHFYSYYCHSLSDACYSYRCCRLQKARSVQFQRDDPKLFWFRVPRRFDNPVYVASVSYSDDAIEYVTGNYFFFNSLFLLKSRALKKSRIDFEVNFLRFLKINLSKCLSHLINELYCCKKKN